MKKWYERYYLVELIVAIGGIAIGSYIISVCLIEVIKAMKG